MTGARRTVTVLGATGSIGASALDLLLRHSDRFAVEAVTANRRAGDLAGLARRVGAKIAVVGDESAYGALRAALEGSGIAAAAGSAALVDAASRPVDICIAGIAGAAGLAPTMAAASAAKALALANKESLVCAGPLLLDAAAAAGTAILPTDSEHNAIFQALGGRDAAGVEEIVLTASGGPFRTLTLEAMRRATPADALRHPTWTMGAKITVDSATLINKGLELIEAQLLFGIAPERLSVLVHPQSLVHGLVRFRDGSILAQLGPADMRVPIAACLAWPERIESGAAPLDLARVASLAFEAPDMTRFPGLASAMDAMRTAGGAPNLFNAGNEVAVALFLEGRLGFLGISALAAATLEAGVTRGLARPPVTIEDVFAVDAEARQIAAHLAPQIASKSW